MADNLDHVILCLQNTQWLNYEIPACIFFAVFQSYIHHMINMLFSVLLKMFKKKKKRICSWISTLDLNFAID